MFPRINIAHLPTQIEELPRLSRFLDGPQLFIKRDDQTGLAFGGNKTRKLEFLLGEALTHKSRTLITAGAIQSNHCRQTAAAAAKFGLDCVLILTGEKPSTPSGNLLLDNLFGARIIWVKDRADRDIVLKATFEELVLSKDVPYLVPYGGSSPIGALGYVQAMQEFISQAVPVDWIILSSSSGGTQTGLLCGAKQFGFPGKILGISIDEPKTKLQAIISQLSNEVFSLTNQAYRFNPDEILVNDDYCSPGYGVFTDLEKEAIKLFAEFEGILLDPVYTGRAAGGLINLIRNGYFKKNSRVLFWHTGGQPALFASAYIGTI